MVRVREESPGFPEQPDLSDHLVPLAPSGWAASGDQQERPDNRDRSVPPDKLEIPETPALRAPLEASVQPDLPDS